MKKTINLIEVNDGRLTIFTNALEKQMFIATHKEGTYHLINNGNAAVEDLYIVIDTEGTGFVLNKTGLTYNECQDLIKHYL